jgi:hypothetical protein
MVEDFFHRLDRHQPASVLNLVKDANAPLRGGI